MGKRIYLEKSDFLQEGAYVILKYVGAFLVQFENHAFVLQKTGETPASLKEKKIYAKVLHWISEVDAITHPVTVYDRLLDENGLPFPSSKITYQQAKVHKNVVK